MFFHYYDDDHINSYPVQATDTDQNGHIRTVAYYPPEESAQDIRRISAFLDDVKYFLWRLVKHKPAFIDDIYDDVVEAWNSSKQHFMTAKLSMVNQLNQEAEQFISRLREFGLLASELKLKLHNVEHWFGELISTHSKKALPKLFACMNNILDSLLEAIFPHKHKVIIEFKNCIRDALI
jgi:hypothetical protein